jgi:hypothetical protein
MRADSPGLLLTVIGLVLVAGLLSAAEAALAGFSRARAEELEDERRPGAVRVLKILDEAQNTSPEQMKMFLTRLGFGSKIVVTGDVTQVDLPSGVRSGLRIVEGILDGIDDVSFTRLTAHDVVRHKLVGRIVAAYDEFDARAEQLRAMRSGSPE